MLVITKQEIRFLTKTGKIRKVSAMTYDLIFDAYYFSCLKATHNKFKYLKISERIAKRSR